MTEQYFKIKATFEKTTIGRNTFGGNIFRRTSLEFRH
jgi:hypothetical protein